MAQPETPKSTYVDPEEEQELFTRYEPLAKEDGEGVVAYEQRLKRSATGYKSHFTQALRYLGDLALAFGEDPTEIGQRQILAQQRTLTKRLIPVQDRYSQLIDISLGEVDAEFYANERKLADDEYSQAMTKVTKLLATTRIPLPESGSSKKQSQPIIEGKRSDPFVLGSGIEAASTEDDEDDDDAGSHEGKRRRGEKPKRVNRPSRRASSNESSSSLRLPFFDPDSPHPSNTGTAGAGARRAPHPKIKPNIPLRPERLSHEATPHEMRMWVEQFRSYYDTSNFAYDLLSSQHAYFKQCLGRTLRARMEARIRATDPMFARAGVRSCIKAIRDEFYDRHPIFNRRIAFFKATQQNGQSMTDFIIQVGNLSDEADIISLSSNDVLLYRYLAGCTNSDLRQKIMELDHPTKAQVEQFVRNYETAKTQDKAVKTPVAQTKKTTHNNSSGGKNSKGNKGSKGQQKKDGKSSQADKKCYRCGANGHLAPDCRLPRDTVCNYCEGKGHLEKVCKKKEADAGRKANVNKSSTSTDGAQENVAKVVYRVNAARHEDERA